MTEYNRLPAERAQSILALLQEQGRVLAGDLALQFGVSEDSIRRDLRELAAQGLCQRVHGGAVLPAPHYAPFQERAALAQQGKADLAALAASMLSPGTVVFLDAGTTNLAIARHLPQKSGITVITNSPQIAIEASVRDGVSTVLIGGSFNPVTGGAIGAEALSQVQKMRVDIGLPGVCELDSVSGIWAMDAEDAAMKRAIVSISAKIIVVATTEKLGARGNFNIASLADIEAVVLDSRAPTFHINSFKNAGISVHQTVSPSVG